MRYYNLDNDRAERAWESFLVVEEEWKKDPTNKDKFLASREAFQEYDKVRMRFYNLTSNEEG